MLISEPLMTKRVGLPLHQSGRPLELGGGACFWKPLGAGIPAPNPARRGSRHPLVRQPEVPVLKAVCKVPARSRFSVHGNSPCGDWADCRSRLWSAGGYRQASSRCLSLILSKVIKPLNKREKMEILRQPKQLRVIGIKIIMSIKSF